MRRIIIIILLLTPLRIHAQTFEEAVLKLTGASELEMLDQQVIERFESLRRRPVPINIVTRSRLLAAGLMTPYQIATLIDYRSRHGDVLSQAELSLIDGFGKETAEALASFVSFDSPQLPGHLPDPPGYESSLLGRYATREGESNWGLKYKGNYGDRLEAAAAARTYYGDPFMPPANHSWYAAAWGRRCLGKFVLGDFNARFGQGLILWSGFSLSSVSTPASFSRRPSGISPSWSYGTASRRGVAADFDFGRVLVSTMYDTRERMPAANVTRLLRNGQVGLTAMCAGADEKGRLEQAGASADWRFCIRGTDLFGEAAYIFPTGEAKALAGVVKPLGDNAVAALRGSWTKDVATLALGTEFLKWTLTAEGTSRPGKNQLKILISRVFSLSDRLSLKLRTAERLRDYDERLRSDVRMDFCLSGGEFLMNWRLNWLKCVNHSWLTYLEAGYKDDKHALWLRGGLFRIDDWEDRIYAYERDAPGSFNVPAYYGRGYNISLVGSCKVPAVGMKAYLRASYVDYPWNKKAKPGRAELRMQVMYDF